MLLAGYADIICNNICRLVFNSAYRLNISHGLPAQIWKCAVCLYFYFMKKMFVLIILASCNGRNDHMTSLINQRKVLTDSLVLYNNTMKQLEDRGSSMNIHGSDSVIWNRMLDTARIAVAGREYAEAKIPELTFSIDSLTKMK